MFGGVDPHEDYDRTRNNGKDIYRFKPDENFWETVGEIPQARHHHSVAYLRGRIYVVGELDDDETNIHVIFNANTECTFSTYSFRQLSL